jgi:hypothetical protein
VKDLYQCTQLSVHQKENIPEEVDRGISQKKIWNQPNIIAEIKKSIAV